MELALSLSSQYIQNRSILSKPISTLAKMSGLQVDDVYDRLLPELTRKDLGEVIKYAQVGLRYATIVDRNRLREELGPKFITAMDMIIRAVKDGLNSDEDWIKRKAMQMHGDLIDEYAEKQRFVETLMVERKLELLRESRERLATLEKEIIDFEEKEGIFEVMVI